MKDPQAEETDFTIPYFRTYGSDAKLIRLCDHVMIHGQEVERMEFDSCEYTDHIVIHCNVCGQNHRIQQLIN